MQNIYSYYVDVVKQLVDSANSEEQKEELILRPVDYTKLAKIDISNNFWQNAYQQNNLAIEITNPKSDLYKTTYYNKYTNALAISICSQDIENIQYFLNYTTPDKVNVYGYKQIFSSVHLATFPNAHMSSQYFNYDEYTLEKAGLVLDILEYAGANFNFVSKKNSYNYPPMAFEIPQFLRIELIKRGADPFSSKTFYYMSDNMDALKISLQQSRDLIDLIDINILQQQYNKMLIANLEQAEQLKEYISTKLGEYDVFKDYAIVGEIDIIDDNNILNQELIGVNSPEGGTIFEPFEQT